MFIGHYAPALIAAAHPRAQRLGALFLAAQFVDIVLFSLVLGGIERMRVVPGLTVMNAMDLYDMPYTHSLLGNFAFAAAWAIVTRLLSGDWSAGLIGGTVVLSHWFLDLLVHAPDLTLAGGGMRYGFGLWNKPGVEMSLEIALIGCALAFYLWRTTPLRDASRLPLSMLVVALSVVQAINWTTPLPSGVIDPVPASQPLTALAAYGLLTGLAIWAGRVRTPRVGPRVRAL
jgi:hypothetical protein